MPKTVHGTTFVQLNGSGNTQTTGLLYASEILSRFASRVRRERAAVPRARPSSTTRATKRAMWRERSTRRILAIHAGMDLVVFSTGLGRFAGAQPRVLRRLPRGRRPRTRSSRSGVVGDVATVFYRADGSSDGIALNERATGPRFDILRRVPRRVCIVSGRSKVASLRGALAAGLVTDLVVDEAAARALTE